MAFCTSVLRRKGKDLKRVNWPKNQSNITGEQRDQLSSSELNHDIWQRHRLGIVTIKNLTALLKRKAKKEAKFPKAGCHT